MFFAITGLAPGYWAQSRNISENGIGLQTNYPVKEGYKFLIHSKDLWPSIRNARVMWCKKIDENTYTAGLST